MPFKTGYNSYYKQTLHDDNKIIVTVRISRIDTTIYVKNQRVGAKNVSKWKS